MVVGSAIAEVMDGVGEPGAAEVDVEVDGAVGEERLDRDTMLSRALGPKTGGPWLRSS